MIMWTLNPRRRVKLPYSSPINSGGKLSEHHMDVFWLDAKRCLRPMLAPNLYTLWKDLLRLWEKPIRIFEIGTCYRKESKGSLHLNEFTMLNLTELGLPEDQRHQRLEELAALVI